MYKLAPGDLTEIMRLRSGEQVLPERVIFGGIRSREVALLGRNHPITETLPDSVLAHALSGEDRQFSHCEPSSPTPSR